MKKTIVVAITGASGSVYATRLLESLHAAACDIHLVISPAAQTVFRQELDLTVDLDAFSPSMLMLDIGSRPNDRKLQDLRAMSGVSSEREGSLTYYHHRDYMGAIASGSFLTDGMVICPCSSGTLSAIVHGTSSNLIHRAAEVHFKERRKLILVPRETPLSLIALDNMKRAAEYGAVILPASPWLLSWRDNDPRLDRFHRRADSGPVRHSQFPDAAMECGRVGDREIGPDFIHS